MTEQFKNMKDMKVGDLNIINSNSHLIRIESGWIYGDLHGTCFIPDERRQFAAMAMQGMISNYGNDKNVDYAKYSVGYADALLAALKEGE